MSYEETLKTYPRYVGIDVTDRCKRINFKIFKVIRPLLMQTLHKSVIKRYEKYGFTAEEAYREYMNLDVEEYRFKIKAQYKPSEEIAREIRLAKMKQEGFDLSEELVNTAEEGLQEQLGELEEMDELQEKYIDKTEQEIRRMKFSINVDLEEVSHSKLGKILPFVEEIERLYVIMPPAADFTDLQQDYDEKIYPKDEFEDKIYKVNDNSIDIKIRTIEEKCFKCKKLFKQSHYISDVVQLPEYMIIYNKKGNEKRIVMPDRIKPFKRKCLYELKGFMVVDEKNRSKITNEITSYLRKDKDVWVKIMNTRKEIEHITDLQLKNPNAIASTETIEKFSKEKVNSGFIVNYEEQYLHKYLYKALIYKLIVK